MERAAVVLDLGYTPDWTPAERAAQIDAFRRALRDLPLWAIKHAFSEWERTRPRRPAPGEIRTLAMQAMKPVGDEIARRRKAAEPIGHERPPPDPERTARIMHEAGFTDEHTARVNRFPTAPTRDAAQLLAERAEDRKPHWSEGLPPDHPRMIRRAEHLSRNTLVREARMAAGLPPDFPKPTDQPKETDE